LSYSLSCIPASDLSYHVAVVSVPPSNRCLAALLRTFFRCRATSLYHSLYLRQRASYANVLRHSRLLWAGFIPFWCQSTYEKRFFHATLAPRLLTNVPRVVLHWNPASGQGPVVSRQIIWSADVGACGCFSPLLSGLFPLPVCVKYMVSCEKIPVGCCDYGFNIPVSISLLLGAQPSARSVILCSCTLFNDHDCLGLLHRHITIAIGSPDAKEPTTRTTASTSS
jgi:hypothetical protein